VQQLGSRVCAWAGHEVLGGDSLGNCFYLCAESKASTLAGPFERSSKIQEDSSTNAKILLLPVLHNTGAMFVDLHQPFLSVAQCWKWDWAQPCPVLRGRIQKPVARNAVEHDIFSGSLDDQFGSVDDPRRESLSGNKFYSWKR
jgi:hypothetical protein